MCSVIIARNVNADWPVLIAANRDEMLDRPWQPPARHWPDRPDVIAGIDELAGGTWLGINDNGVIATILNRQHTLGPEDGKRSRGELVLEALDHADAKDAAEALLALNAAAYRPFNMLIADNETAVILIGRGAGRVEAQPVPDGISMITHADMNELSSARIARYLPQFKSVATPDPDAGSWQSWINLLGNRDGATPTDALNIVTEIGFGTGSSALLALPAIEHADKQPVFLFADGRPDEVSYRSVADLRSAQDAAMQQFIV